MSDKVKGIRMSEDVKERAEAMYKASGLKNEGEWFESLLNMAQLQELGNLDPVFEQDVKDFEKIANRFYYLFINIIGRSKDAIEEVKNHTQQEVVSISTELEALRSEFLSLQEQLEQKDEELNLTNSKISENQSKIDQFEKTVNALEDLNQMTNEKNKQLELRIKELLQLEIDAQELRGQLIESKKQHEQELTRHNEESTRLRQQLVDQQKEIERIETKYMEEIEKLQNEYKRDIQMTRKEVEMEAKDNLLMEKGKWQEIKAQELREQSERHNSQMAELLKKIQDKQ